MIASVHSVRLSHLFSLLFSTRTHSLCVCVCLRFIDLLWLHWVFVAVQGPLPVVVSKACSVISVCSLLVVVSVVKSVGSSAHGLQ